MNLSTFWSECRRVFRRPKRVASTWKFFVYPLRMSNARVEYSLKLLTVFAVGLAWLATGSLSAQTLGQPPVEACKPGDFTVVGYPFEFGPKAGANFPVLIDEKFEGEFLTTEKIWVPVINKAVDKWNGIGGSDWSFTIEGFGGADGGDGKTTIAACGFNFNLSRRSPRAPRRGGSSRNSRHGRAPVGDRGNRDFRR